MAVPNMVTARPLSKLLWPHAVDHYILRGYENEADTSAVTKRLTHPGDGLDLAGWVINRSLRTAKRNHPLATKYRLKCGKNATSVSGVEET